MIGTNGRAVLLGALLVASAASRVVAYAGTQALEVEPLFVLSTSEPEACGRAEPIVNAADSGSYDSESWDVLAANPDDPENLIAGWHEFAGTNCEIHVRATHDGGTSWSEPMAVLSPDPAGESGAAVSAGDLDIAFGRTDEGRPIAYLVTPAASSGTLELRTSLDGGLTWSSPTSVTPPPFAWDDGSIAPHPTSPCRVYAVGTDGYVGAAAQPGNVLSTSMTVSEDCGRSWADPWIVHSGRGAWGPRLTVVDDGTEAGVLIFTAAMYKELTDTAAMDRFADVGGEVWILAQRSFDGGAEWDRMTRLGDGLHSPDEAQLGGTHVFVSTDVARDRSVLATWSDHKTPSTVWLARTRDLGTTWSLEPVVASSASNLHSPRLAVTRSNRVGIMFHDSRPDRASSDDSDPPFYSDVWVRFRNGLDAGCAEPTRDGESRCREWTEVRITDVHLVDGAAERCDTDTNPNCSSRELPGTTHQYHGFTSVGRGFALTVPLPAPFVAPGNGANDLFFTTIDAG